MTDMMQPFKNYLAQIGKPHNQVTLGEFNAMPAEMKAAYDAEWLRRVSQDGIGRDLDREEEIRNGEDYVVTHHQSSRT